MKQDILIIFSILFLIVAFSLGLAVVSGSFRLWYTNHFGVAQQNANTRVFHESDAYMVGNQQQFESFRNDCRHVSVGSQEEQIIINRIERFADSIPQNQVPNDISNVISTHHCAH